MSHPGGSHLPPAVCAGHGKTGSEGQSQRGAGMLIHLRSQATTPMVRAAIRESTEPASALAERFGTTGQTVFKWKHLASVHDRSHRPHRVQTALTPAQEAVAVALRRTLLVSLDDLLAVVRAFLDGKEFTDRLFGLCKRAATSQHEFNLLCADLGIKHRLTPPPPPQTTALVERCNRWVGRGRAALPPLPIRRGPGDHAAPLRPALPPAVPALSPGQQVALAGDEGLAQTEV